MDVVARNRNLMGRRAISLTVVNELWFERGKREWKWVEVEGIPNGAKVEGEISTENAVRWADKHLEFAWKPELRFAKRFPSLRLIFTAGETTYRFNANGWDLIGIGFAEWDFDPYEGYPQWTADQYLFASQKSFLLIEEPRFWEAPRPSGITGKLLEPREAAEWCLNNDIELPESLEADCPIDLLTPDNITNIAPAETEPATVENDNSSDEDCEESSDAIEIPQGPIQRESLTVGLSTAEMNMLAKLIELERQYSKHPEGSKNPLWRTRYDRHYHQCDRQRQGKRNLAVIAREIFEAEKDSLQNLNVQ